MFVQEFYTNIHGIDTFVPCFATTFQDTHIAVTPNLISEVLHVSRVSHPDHLGYECLQTISTNELMSHFYETLPYGVGSKTPHAQAVQKV